MTYERMKTWLTVQLWRDLVLKLLSHLKVQLQKHVENSRMVARSNCEIELREHRARGAQ